MSKKGWLVSSLVVICLLATVCSYTGYVNSYLDDEVQTKFFVKKYPTLKMRFYDPFANEGDDVPIESLSRRDRLEFSDYCKFRFGISNDGNVSLGRCKAETPNYLK